MRTSRRQMRRRARPGATLLEVIVAVTLVAMIGLTSVALVRSLMRLAGEAANAEREMTRGSDFLAAVSLWSRAELDQRLGQREQGHWVLEIDRPVPELYVVALLDSTRTSVLLRTALFRAEPSSAER